LIKQRLFFATKEDLEPLLAYVDSLGDRFTLSANTEDGPIGITPSMLVGLPGPFGIQNLIR